MKAILVIDLPESCNTCDYCGYAVIDSSDGDEYKYRSYGDKYKYRSCCLSQKYLGEIGEEDRDVSCPLKPLPQKKEIGEVYLENVMHVSTYYDKYQEQIMAKVVYDTEVLQARGWNACIEELENE